VVNRDTSRDGPHGGEGERFGLGKLSLFRCRLCIRITVFVFLSILVIEACILVPSYFKRQQELLDSLMAAGLTALSSGLQVRGHNEAAEFSFGAQGMESPAFDPVWPLVGFRLYSPSGALLGAYGEAPDPDTAAIRRKTGRPAYAADSSRYDVYWTAEDLRAPLKAVARLDSSRIDADLRSFVWRISGLVVLISLFVCSGTMAALFLTVLKPILELRSLMLLAKEHPESADQFASKRRGRDEMGDITDAYDDLVRRLTLRYRSNLREREQRFEDFAQAVSDWFWEMDENLRFSYFSERFTQVTGVPNEMLLGKTRQETGIPGVDPDLWQQHLSDLAARRPFRDFTHPRTKANGDVVWLAISGKPYFDQEGKFRGYRGIGRDITHLKRFEEDLRHSRDQAEQANRAKSAFLANMSHELRTPLNAVIGYAEVIESELLGSIGQSKYSEYAKYIRTSGWHLIELINDILDLSKIEASAFELIDETISIADLLSDVDVLIQGQAHKARVDVSYRIQDDLPHIRADARRLKQIFTNVLVNAIKFTPAHGSVSFEVACEPGVGHVVQVTDTGIGIAPEDIPAAMAPFQQVDAGLNRKYEGTGLGLPLTKALVEAHGGSLELQSESGVGTTVTLRFPADRIVTCAPSRPARAKVGG